ncbi:hypothetical protein M2451_002827 [Dysgonomonas sp. PFB1-18]|uniref:hypothetical protein n=1 Tax=unclassified Dysgonomonas TaxID=2630389 RepID=UPI002475E888|nr:MULTISPECIES: hypothetical protein [unclassified Dysgonomonas]MDH6309287.1 hypothetical protein [Dysgonomonas sp. PF1-14]MDH6339848.1 hypothetical protein [Dysgonomonas sp. PF1-16]MDH6381496.1 hypothetical protein [Dysgonomonas sp. PFB1-18]MDH6398711.1 hypothetical protein [Dysgonomonas sp. PF1-23]
MNRQNKKHITTLLFVAVVTFLFIFAGCKPTMVYVPVESVKTEYRDKIQRDSVHLYDSVLIKMKGDTIWLEKYKYLYRDKLIRDSIFRTDSIQVPYPVEVEKETNRLTSFQAFQIWCGRILLLMLIGWLALNRLKKLINK